MARDMLFNIYIYRETDKLFFWYLPNKFWEYPIVFQALGNKKQNNY